MDLYCEVHRSEPLETRINGEKILVTGCPICRDNLNRQADIKAAEKVKRYILDGIKES